MSPDAEALVNEYDALALAPECGVAELAVVGRDLDALIANLQAVRKSLGNRLADMLDGQAKTEIPGFGVLERTRWTRWEPYDNDSELTLVRHVAHAARGTVRSPITAARRAGELIHTAASMTWRVTQLRDLTLDPHHYLEQKHGDWSVKIPKE